MASEANSNIEILPWLKGLAVAPEYHPTIAEFKDPIAYIYKIEKEASQYGICKIIPPLCSAPRKTAISNLNRSLSARSGTGGPNFTTRQQQIGFCVRKNPRPVQKPVWQSGESYTVKEFEAKAKGFERNYLKKCGFSKKSSNLSGLEIETLYWKAGLDKPFTVEYANDMPGSAFSNGQGSLNSNSNVTVGETEWNMRGVSRAKGSLLRFMKEEIPGVTSPMVYIAMMFSWFAWHVEDHDLHSLNYLHMGAGKTWYGVPRDAAVAFEEVIRVHGYGGEINPLVTFATLGEKNTVMSAEVLVNAGIPCCRLVQNPGEFVVTFPRAYHSGFSHGFNCGEAANIATPEWLTVAKDGAIRRASINCPPMVSHFQLLYDLALSLSSRVPKNIRIEPRSSRLKDKKKSEGEILVKDLFVKDVMQNNNLFHILGKGSSVVILPRISLSKSSCSTLEGGSQSKVNARSFPSLCSPDLVVKTRKSLDSDDIVLDRNQGNKQVIGAYSMKGKHFPVCDGSDIPFSGRGDRASSCLGSQSRNMDHVRDGDPQCDRVSNQGLFSCVTCGILCFASVAIIQPTETASQCLMSGDFSIFTDQEGTTDGLAAVSKDVTAPESNSLVAGCIVRTSNDLFDIPVQSADQIQPLVDEKAGVSNAEVHKDTSSLGLLASTYGNCSDSEDDEGEADIPVEVYETNSRNSSPRSSTHGASNNYDPPCSPDNCANGVPLKIDDFYAKHGFTKATIEARNDKTFDCFLELEINNQSAESKSSRSVFEDQKRLQHVASNCNSNASVPLESKSKPFAPRSDEDSSRMHVFCLQHAVQVEQQLRAIGGAHVVILCHPDYPKLEAQAKMVAEDLGNDYFWSDISFREGSREDEEIIQLALHSEEAIHGNGDWAVKLGINLYYSANLSRSSLYSKQMPYNSTIYNAFGHRSPANTLTKTQPNGKWSGRHKNVVVAGKWCGKVWTSNQVHPLLAEGESEEQDQVRNVLTPVKSDLKLDRPSVGTKTAETASPPCKSGRKRKTTRSITKAEESLKAEDPDEAFEVPPVSSKQHNLRNKRMKKETLEPQINSERNNRKIALHAEDELEGGPSTRLRTRSAKPSKDSGRKVEVKPALKKQLESKKAKKGLAIKAPVRSKNTKIREEAEYPCDLDTCTMSFATKQELILHKRNICPVKGCGKKFFSHKYLVQHRRVHVDDRPLECPWKGCKMTFKWAWARTEHIRVHTGARPYVCSETGCGQTFRFVSDFSRHKRKTGHTSKKVKR